MTPPDPHDSPRSAALLALLAVLALTSAGCGDDPMAPGDGGTDGDVSDSGVPIGDSATADGSDDAATGDGSLPPASDWPLPVPGSPGTGPACPEPTQVAPGADWPEVFVGVADCDDDGDGSRATPFCTFERAFEVADAAPGIVTILEGTYRQRSHRVSRPGSADAYFLIRADEGARPVILGSDPLDGAAFEDAGDGLFRVDASALANDPAGLWTDAGRRIIHVMEFRDGVRSHASTADVVEPGQWTKADAGGTGCDGENPGCFIYVRPFADMEVATTAFEASQGSFITAIGGSYMVIDGISTRFTQSTAIFFEGAEYIVIQNGDFAHNANSNDNSYNLRLWGADGAIVRRNRVSDSRYWGGAVNSHGITFMVTGDDADIWVCENEVFDTVGGGVSTKSGSSNVHVVGNWLHDLGAGVRIPGSRCHWRGCDERRWPGGGYDIRENLFESCGTGVSIDDRAQDDAETVTIPSRIYNNVFVDTEAGVEMPRVGTPPLVRNNIFTDGGNGVYFRAGGTETWPDYYLALGFDSDNNLFDGDAAVYNQANWSGLEQAYSLDEYRAEYDGEESSVSDDPALGERYLPAADSPVRGAGDPSVYDGGMPVHIGLWPFAG